MTTGNLLLHLDSSHGPDSVSRELSASFAARWLALGGRVRYRDLVADPAPPVSPEYVRLTKRVEAEGGLPVEKVAALAESAAERKDWAATAPLIEEVLAADVLVIGSPMYNFGISASLKAWIDRITVPGVFAGDALARTRVVVVTARGGAYGPGTPRQSYDFQEPYLRAYLTDKGVPEDGLSFVHAEFTRADTSPRLTAFGAHAAASLAAARERVTGLAEAYFSKGAVVS